MFVSPALPSRLRSRYKLGLQQLLLLGLAHKLIATLKPTSQNGNAAIEPATPTSCRPNVAYCLLPFVDCRSPIAGQPVFGGQQENQRAAAKKYAPIGVKSQALCEKLQAK